MIRLSSRDTSISQSADSRGADSPGADRRGADSPGADRRGADSPGADSRGADSPGADSPGADRRGADTPAGDGQGTDKPVEFSAGGVVVRDDQVVVIVPVKRAADGSRVLGLPKGHPDEGESPEQAALREIWEETGVTVDLIDELGEIEYEYERRRRRVIKRVRFYLCKYRSGDLADHDDEIADARWMPLEEAVTALTYAGEREIVARALSRAASDR